MRIAVVGAGGVGGYFGARLVQAGEDVTFIARGTQLQALRTQGLRIESPRGNATLGPQRATEDPREVGPVDAVLLCVKTWQLTDAAAASAPLLGRETCVVPFQNGVEAADQLTEVLGPGSVLGAVAKIVAFIDGPGRIRDVGGPTAAAFAELDNRPSARVDRLRNAFRGAGLEVEEPPDIHAAIWIKFLFVATAGGIGAVARQPIGVLRRVPDARRLLQAGMGEIAALAAARGVRLPDDIVARTMAFVDTLPPAGTASLQRDIVEGRRSELDAWSGAVVRLGLAAGVPTPVHSFIYGSLLPSELHARGQL
ncbi:MAG TPA: 2-dehydropantoate 2-reductase [Gemmatimonadales bacterium]|nr:2-dehydropantoate 2-reductase [Gemmatimonadales bacterium]